MEFQSIKAYGETIQSKLFAVGEKIEHNGKVVEVTAQNAPGHQPGHVEYAFPDGRRAVAWANHCERTGAPS